MKEQKLPDFTNAKAGDKVYHIIVGWTEIKEILPVNNAYRITTNITTFTIDGKVYDSDLNSMLYWHNPFTHPDLAYTRPIELPKKGQVIAVREKEGDEWGYDVFNRFDDDYEYPMLCHSGNNWKIWRHLNTKELGQ
jgi:hypothetical protein